MRVRPDSVVAFKEEYFQGKPELGKFLYVRLKVNKQNVIGVHAKHYKEVCKILKLPQSRITSKRTPYNGVYLAVITGPKIELKDTKQAMRQKYMEIASGPRVDRAKQLEKSMCDQKAYINKLQIELVKCLRDLEEKDQEYQSISAGGPTVLENKGIEFDKLMAHPDIIDISIKGNFIEVLTEPIDIEHRGKVYDIGRFRIVLSINPSQFIVKFYNLTRSIHNCFHPHVHTDGLPCLGNISECLPAMIADRQFAAAISVCIQYLKSTNDGGHYSHVNNWPLKKKTKEKREDGEKGIKIRLVT